MRGGRGARVGLPVLGGCLPRSLAHARHNGRRRSTPAPAPPPPPAHQPLSPRVQVLYPSQHLLEAGARVSLRVLAAGKHGIQQLAACVCECVCVVVGCTIRRASMWWVGAWVCVV